jgi:hypothetical protein
MRHLLARIVVIVLAVLIVVMSAVFALVQGVR